VSASTDRAHAASHGARLRVATSAKLLVMGALLGLSLSSMGFTSWDEVHAMFTLADPRLLLTFLSGVALLGGAFAYLRARTAPSWPARPLERGTVVGGVLFGLGWALSGACPGVVFTQLGEGRLLAFLALAGMLGGNALAGAFERGRSHPRNPSSSWSS
jgi:uncharacterized membrane protein YedE/YeeE